MKRHVLVTGGAGYIGSHTCVALIAAGCQPVVLDNLSNSSAVALDRVRSITGGPPVPFVAADLRDRDILELCFSSFPIEAVIHFAGLKAVGESVRRPLDYYGNNILSTLALLEAMNRHGCRRLIFSSSAAVYGVPSVLPIPEEHELRASSPYGRTKQHIEEMLDDLARSDPRWHIALLRYFNPVGAHPSGLIGEAPADVPNNLFPCVTQHLVGRRPQLEVLGTDYSTRDGSGVRDYLHVCDLAEGHVAALRKIDELRGAVPINLGTGRGYSVLEVIGMFERVTGRRVDWRAAPRRAGDVPECFADPGRAARLLGWRARKSLREMCRDSWHWQSTNPAGYEGEPRPAKPRRARAADVATAAARRPKPRRVTRAGARRSLS